MRAILGVSMHVCVSVLYCVIQKKKIRFLRPLVFIEGRVSIKCRIPFGLFF